MNAENKKLATRAQRERALEVIMTAIRCTHRQIWFYGILSTLSFAIAFVLFL